MLLVLSFVLVGSNVSINSAKTPELARMHFVSIHIISIDVMCTLISRAEEPGRQFQPSRSLTEGLEPTPPRRSDASTPRIRRIAHCANQRPATARRRSSR